MLINKGRLCPAQRLLADEETVGVGTYECTCCSKYNGDRGYAIDCLWQDAKSLSERPEREPHKCWFCGSTKVEVQRFTYDGRYIQSVVCLDCGAMGPDGKGEQSAIKLWNEPVAYSL